MNGCRVFNSKNIPIANSIDTPLTFDTVIFDTDGYFDPSHPSRITCPAGLAGYHLIIAGTQWANDNQTHERLAYLRVNGDQTSGVIMENREQVSANNMAALVVPTIFYLNEGDYVESMAKQNAGVIVNVITSLEHTPVFMCARLG